MPTPRVSPRPLNYGAPQLPRARTALLGPRHSAPIRLALRLPCASISDFLFLRKEDARGHVIVWRCAGAWAPRALPRCSKKYSSLSALSTLLAPDRARRRVQICDARPSCVTRVKGRDSHSPIARLAQSAERKALNLVVVGSSPTVGAFFPSVRGGHGAPL